MAEASVPFGARVVPHVCAGPVALAANLHCAATVPQIRLIEYPPSLAGAWAIFAPNAALGPPHIVDGAVAVPSGPGLGVDFDEAVAAAHPYRPPRRLAGVRADASDDTRNSRSGLPDRFVGDR